MTHARSTCVAPVVRPLPRASGLPPSRTTSRSCSSIRSTALAMKMADLCRQLGQWDTVYQVLARMLEVASRDQDKMDVYVQLGELCGAARSRSRQGHVSTTARPSSSTARTCPRWWPSSASTASAVSGDGSWSRSSSARAGFRGGELHAVPGRPGHRAGRQARALAASTAIASTTSARPSSSTRRSGGRRPGAPRGLRGIEPLYQQRERWPTCPRSWRPARGGAHREGAHHHPGQAGSPVRGGVRQAREGGGAALRARSSKIGPSNLDALSSLSRASTARCSVGTIMPTSTSGTSRPRPTARKRSRSTKALSSTTPASSRIGARHRHLPERHESR